VQTDEGHGRKEALDEVEALDDSDALEWEMARDLRKEVRVQAKLYRS
jgi:hypothetical protein